MKTAAWITTGKVFGQACEFRSPNEIAAGAINHVETRRSGCVGEVSNPNANGGQGIRRTSPKPVALTPRHQEPQEPRALY